MDIKGFKELFILIILFGTIFIIFLECCKCLFPVKCNCFKKRNVRVCVEPQVVIGIPIEIRNNDIIVVGERCDEDGCMVSDANVVDAFIINNRW